MSNSDWLFEVGVDTTKADSALQDFVKRTTKTLSAIPNFSVRVDTTGATNVVNQFVKGVQSRVKQNFQANITANNTQALGAIGQVTQALKGVQAASKSSLGGIAVASGSASSSMRGLRTEIESNTKTLDFFNRAWSYSLLKFAEFEIISKSIEGTIHELADSLKEASDVQFELSLQKLYNPQVFDSMQKQNQALQSATTIARQWGADIRDVLQVQGLWTKQTGDLASAQYLAAQAEMMHRASGIDTLEVYRSTVALMSQLGQTGDKLPRLYDQISEAATRMAVPLNNLSGKGRMEALKEVFEGLAGSSATLKAMGFIDSKSGDASAAIATISTLVQALGKDAKTVSSNLDAMFAALEGKGKQRETFFSIIGKDAKTPLEMLDRMIAKRDQLLDAGAKGELGVRPQQFEILQTFIGNLEQIKKSMIDIQQNSKGMLETIARSQMQLLQGQTDRLRASLQQFTIALGTEFTPSAMSAIHTLDALLPILSANAGGVANLSKEAVQLGVALVGWQIILKASAWFKELASDQAAASLAAGRFLDKQLASVGGMQLAVEQMQREKAALADIAEAQSVAAWRATGLQEASSRLGVTIGEVSAIAENRAVNGFAAMGAAAGAATARFVAMAAPLLAIQEVMASLESYSTKENRISTAIDNLRNQAKADYQNPLEQIGSSADMLWHHGVAAYDFGGREYRDFNNTLYEAKRDKNYGPRFSALMTILHLRRQFLSVKPWLVIPICQQTG